MTSPVFVFHIELLIWTLDLTCSLTSWQLLPLSWAWSLVPCTTWWPHTLSRSPCGHAPGPPLGQDQSHKFWDHKLCWEEDYLASNLGGERWLSGCTSDLAGFDRGSSKCGHCWVFESWEVCTDRSPSNTGWCRHPSSCPRMWIEEYRGCQLCFHDWTLSGFLSLVGFVDNMFGVQKDWFS